MIDTITLLLLGAVSVISAIYLIFSRSILNAVLASGVISLLASIIFLIAGAPDVAMTEATIGSALTTVVFLYALKHVKAKKEGQDD